MTSRWDHMGNSVRGVGQEGDPVQSFTESPPSENSWSGIERGAVDAWSAPGRFCELFDLPRWCSVVRRPGPLGGWASANYVFRPTWVSRHTRSRRVDRANSNGANHAIELTRLIRRVAAKPSR